MLKKLLFIFAILLLTAGTSWTDVDEILGISTVDEYLGISTADEFLGQTVASGGEPPAGCTPETFGRTTTGDGSANIPATLAVTLYETGECGTGCEAEIFSFYASDFHASNYEVEPVIYTSTGSAGSEEPNELLMDGDAVYDAASNATPMWKDTDVSAKNAAIAANTKYFIGVGCEHSVTDIFRQSGSGMRTFIHAYTFGSPAANWQTTYASDDTLYDTLELCVHVDVAAED